MCFRVKATRPKDIAAKIHGLIDRILIDLEAEAPTLADEAQAQAFPTLPVVADGALVWGQWGLRPAWSEASGRGDEGRRATLNCRSEDMFTKVSFRDLAPVQRCLLVVDWFVEWRHPPQGGPLRYRVFSGEGDPLYLGGLWQAGPEGPLFTVCTRPADRLMAWVHNRQQRMPVVVPPGAAEAWLTPGAAPALAEILEAEVNLVAEGPTGDRVTAATLPPAPKAAPVQGDLF